MEKEDLKPLLPWTITEKKQQLYAKIWGDKDGGRITAHDHDRPTFQYQARSQWQTQSNRATDEIYAQVTRPNDPDVIIKTIDLYHSRDIDEHLQVIHLIRQHPVTHQALDSGDCWSMV